MRTVILMDLQAPVTKPRVLKRVECEDLIGAHRVVFEHFRASGCLRIHALEGNYGVRYLASSPGIISRRKIAEVLTDELDEQKMLRACAKNMEKQI